MSKYGKGSIHFGHFYRKIFDSMAFFGCEDKRTKLSITSSLDCASKSVSYLKV